MDNVMDTCLSATISRVGDGIRARVQNLSQLSGVSITDSVNKHMNATCDLAFRMLSMNIIDTIQKHINVRCSVVCSLSEVVAFLKVSPDEIQWITDDMGVFFDVESNVDWIIVNS